MSSPLGRPRSRTRRRSAPPARHRQRRFRRRPPRGRGAWRPRPGVLLVAAPGRGTLAVGGPDLAFADEDAAADGSSAPYRRRWSRTAKPGLRADRGRPTEAFAAFSRQPRVSWRFRALGDPQAKGIVERLQDFAERGLGARGVQVGGPPSNCARGVARDGNTPSTSGPASDRRCRFPCISAAPITADLPRTALSLSREGSSGRQPRRDRGDEQGSGYGRDRRHRAMCRTAGQPVTPKGVWPPRALWKREAASTAYAAAAAESSSPRSRSSSVESPRCAVRSTVVSAALSTTNASAFMAARRGESIGRTWAHRAPQRMSPSGRASRKRRAARSARSAVVFVTPSRSSTNAAAQRERLR